MRRRGGWIDVRPNDKMKQYDALRDPHLRTMHEGERVKKHLNKMKQREQCERRNPETEAKLAWRKDVHEIYGQPIGVVKKVKTPSRKPDNQKVANSNADTTSANPTPANSTPKGSTRSDLRSKSDQSISRSNSESSYEMINKPNEEQAASISSATLTPRDENIKTAEGVKSEDEVMSGSYSEQSSQQEDFNGDKQSESSCEYSEDEYSEASQQQQPTTIPSLNISDITTKLRRIIEPDYSTKGLNKPVEISQNIYLSCVKGARNTKLLSELGVNLVINCAPSQCRTSKATYADTAIDYQEIAAIDEEGYQLLESHFTDVKRLVEERLNNSQKVLIHCFQGVNRSATFIIALLMSLQKMDLFKAAAATHSKRPVILQGNDSFVEQLIRFADKLSLLIVPEG